MASIYWELDVDTIENDIAREYWYRYMTPGTNKLSVNLYISYTGDAWELGYATIVGHYEVPEIGYHTLHQLWPTLEDEVNEYFSRGQKNQP